VVFAFTFQDNSELEAWNSPCEDIIVFVIDLSKLFLDHCEDLTILISVIPISNQA
jgi:hypothetical protein